MKGSNLFRADFAYTKYRVSGLVPRAMASSVAGARADFSTQSTSTSEPVVSVDWLHANLKEPDLKSMEKLLFMSASTLVNSDDLVSLASSKVVMMETRSMVVSQWDFHICIIYILARVLERPSVTKTDVA